MTVVDERGHEWSGGVCDRCGGRSDWPLARQACPVRPTKRTSAKLSDEEARERARLQQRERRARMNSDSLREMNRRHKRAQRERERQNRNDDVVSVHGIEVREVG